jgi:hypothetical protein
MKNEFGAELDRNGYAPSLIPWPIGCFVCGRQDRPLQRHEIIHGPYREKSKRYGLWEPLCDYCHARAHRDSGLDRKLKVIMQHAAMLAYGWSLDDWRRVFGKNYEEGP